MLVDENDATEKYPVAAFANLRHRDLSGGVVCLDIVNSEDVLPYSKPISTIDNSSLENFFHQFVTRHTFLRAKQALNLLNNGHNMNSRTIEYASKQENVDVNSKITITAYCLAVNETGTSNWVISVHFEDLNAEINEGHVEISVTEQEENVLRSRINCNDSKPDLLHFTRTIKLKNTSQVAFVRGNVKYKREGISGWITCRSPVIVLLGKSPKEIFKNLQNK